MPNVGQGSHEVWLFHEFCFSPQERWIERAGVRLNFSSRMFDVLLVLAERAGAVVSKRELLERVWPDSLVDEVSLRVQIAALRKALGAGKDGNHFIANVAGKGYSFTSTISKIAPATRFQGENQQNSRTNLPVLASRMFGRESEIANVTRQLMLHRFVTIAGPGGIGKTTLAISVANALAMDFGQDIGFVNLSPITHPDLVVPTLASAFRVGTANDDPARHIISFLRSRRVLIVLDCCEHVIDAAASIAERLILEAPNVFLLATSREPLRAQAEHIHQLFPLDVPASDAGASAAKALSSPAVRLFIEKAAAISDRFTFDDAIAPAVVEICRRLDGIPLAIELAAARIGVFGVLGVSEALSDVLTLLGDGRRTALPRHQTLRATLDWSYRLLTPIEQTAMRRLSVFRGQFTLDSAIAILSFNGTSTIEAREAVGQLISKSLLVPDPGRKSIRYRFLDTTRAYAMEQLTRSGELTEIRRRHAIHCVTFFLGIETDWEIEPREKWLEKYSIMIDDVRAVQDWAFSEDGDLRLGLSVTVESAPLLFAMLLMEEYCDRATQAVKILRRITLDASEIEAKLRLALGVATFHSRGIAPAVASEAARALAIAERAGNETFQMRALWQLARERSINAEYRSALDYCESFSAIAENAPDMRMRVVRDRMMALGLFFVGRFKEARIFGERAVAHSAAFVRSVHMSFNEYDHRVAARSHLARILWPLGLHKRASQIAAEGVDHGLKLGYAPANCYILANAAIPIAFWSRDLAKARAYIGLLRENAADLPHGYWHSWLELFERVADLIETPASRSTREIDAVLAHIRTPFAADLVVTFDDDFLSEIAVQRMTGGEMGWSTSEIIRTLGVRHANQGRREEAASLFLRAIDVAQKQGALSWELRGATSLARLCEQERSNDAPFVLKSIYQRLCSDESGGDLWAAERLLEQLGFEKSALC